MVPFLTVFAVALLLLVGSVILLIWSQKKFGIAEPPLPIEELRQNIKADPIHIDLTPFTPGKELFGRKTFVRVFIVDDGKWQLTVELENEVVVAFEAVFKHKKSWWLGLTIDGWNKYPKILMPGE